MTAQRGTGRRTFFLLALFSLVSCLLLLLRLPQSAAPIVDQHAPTVHLVIASLRKDDISWTSKLRIPSLRVIRYVSDAPAEFTPPVPKKGREALIYHTYFHDFYDTLPDISILIHAHEDP